MKEIEKQYLNKNPNYYDYDREELLQYIPKDVKRLLDVGCSTGGFGQLVKDKFNIEVFGIEPHSESASEARGKLDHVIEDYFPVQGEYEIGKFSCISFNDVLEHIADPWNALQHAKAMLTDDGYVLASIPNIQCYSVLKEIIFQGDFNYRDSGILDKTHLRFFTRKSILRLFNQSGFNVVSIEGKGSIMKGSRLLRLLNLLNKRVFEDMNYQSFVVLASPRQ